MVSISVEVCSSTFNISVQNVKISGSNFQLVEKDNTLLIFPLIILQTLREMSFWLLIIIRQEKLWLEIKSLLFYKLNIRISLWIQLMIKRKQGIVNATNVWE